MRLVLTGATGNTGGAVLRRLRERRTSSSILALVRPTSDTRSLENAGVAIHRCDLADSSTYRHLLGPRDTLVEMANLRHARVLLPAFAAAGSSRAFCVTTTGVFSAFNSYSRLYKEIEHEMRAGPAEVTILRPSMIYGNERDHNMHRLLRTLARVPAFPVFGSGMALVQPVHVEDLADGIVAAIERDARGEFNLAGPEPQTYTALLEDALAALSRRIRLIRVPHAPVAALARLGERMPGFPIRHEQVMRLQEDKAFDIESARTALAYRPRPFRQGIAEEAARLRTLGLLPP